MSQSSMIMTSRSRKQHPQMFEIQMSQADFEKADFGRKGVLDEKSRMRIEKSKFGIAVDHEFVTYCGWNSSDTS